MKYDRLLMERHRIWNTRCTGDDVGFVLIEFNQAKPEALIVYKYFAAGLNGMLKSPAFKVLGDFRNADGKHLPLFIARYWPEIWAFKLGAQNQPAVDWMCREYRVERGWLDFTEKEFATMLIKLRGLMPHAGDRQYIKRLNEVVPPAERSVVPASAEQAMHADRMLSERHYAWPRNCPCVDVDYLLCEFNHSKPIAIVDYKLHHAGLEKTHAATYEALAGLHGPGGKQLPFLVVRYWPDDWAFRVKAVNPAAVQWVSRLDPTVNAERDWLDMTEQQYVQALFQFRAEALAGVDWSLTDGLNQILPPSVAEAA